MLFLLGAIVVLLLLVLGCLGSVYHQHEALIAQHRAVCVALQAATSALASHAATHVSIADQTTQLTAVIANIIARVQQGTLSRNEIN